MTIPPSVREIGYNAFSSCWKLRMNMNVRGLRISPDAFASKNGLTELRGTQPPWEKLCRSHAWNEALRDRKKGGK